MFFLSLQSPESTTSVDLYKHVKAMFEETKIDDFIDRDKLIGMGSDGAANMLGAKSGLATLLKKDHPEVVSVHCLCHRLELAFRDVTKLKCKDLHTKMVTVLTGLHTFYKKSYKNKKALQRAWEALEIKGTMPPKVNGTRWLAHVSRGISGLLHNFQAYHMQLSTASHGNAKAEGLIKLMLQKNVMAFILTLQEILDPLQRLSLKLQSDTVTLADAIVWYEMTVDILLSFKSREVDDEDEALRTLLQDGTYKGVQLKGKTPSISYRDEFIDLLVDSLDERFGFREQSVVQATLISNLSRWPCLGSNDIKDFGIVEIQLLLQQFPNALSAAGIDVGDKSAVIRDWNALKCILYKRYGKDLPSAKWIDINKEFRKDFPSLLFIDLVLSLPPTSVKCETTFSQMKLIKTSQRCRLRSSTLNTLMTVKLESPCIQDFDPEPIVDRFLSVPAGHARGRRIHYHRKKGSRAATQSDPLCSVSSTSTTSQLQDGIADALGSDQSDTESGSTDDELNRFNKATQYHQYDSGSDFGEEAKNTKLLLELARRVTTASESD